MFKKARLKLTLWYLGILLIVSGIFSGLVYRQVSKDIERGFRRGMLHMRMQNLNDVDRDAVNWHQQMMNQDFFVQDIDRAKHDLLLSLVLINITVTVVAGFGSYYLAGETLKPIQLVLQKQKQFIADAAHELKTPITALKTSLEVNLLDKKIDKTTKQILNENLSDVKNLQKLSAQLLQLARSENYVYKKQKFKLLPVIKKVVQQLQPLIQSKQLILELNIPSQQMIDFDKQGFQQIITILIDNAIKFSHKQGKIKILTKLVEGKTQLIVQDYGVGIAKQDLPFIFDRFYQAGTSRTKTKQPSFGLGLSLAQNIARKNDIQIHVDSKKGQGSSFIFII